jgi:signal transduction histidine kinase
MGLLQFGGGSVSRSGAERANRFMLLILGLQRVSYLIPTAATFGSAEYLHADINRLLIVVTVGWNIALMTTATRRGWFSRWVCWADVGWASFLLVAVPLNSPAGAEYDSINWATRFGQAAAALAGAAIEPLALAAGAVVILVAAHGIATAVVLQHSSQLVGELITCVNDLVWFALILGFALRYLRRQGRMLDQLTADEAAAQATRSAERARDKLRLAHYRSLHDTVLATLTAIARGHLDHGSEPVRQRCAADAEQIRALLAGQAADGTSVLADRLAGVVASAGELGLQVRRHYQDLPRYLPSEVVDAAGDAVREALNNIVKHSGVTQAWLTVFWSEDSLQVRVVDRGRGFSADPASFGFGLRQSVIGRMREIGGDARITAAPGDGTCVELTWTG